MVGRREIYTKRTIKMNEEQEEMWNRLKEPAPIIDKDGTQRWFNKAGQLHRENDLPAYIDISGYKEWWINGKRHRENDLPARTWGNGLKEWWKNGKYIRSEKLPQRSHNKY